MELVESANEGEASAGYCGGGHFVCMEAYHGFGNTALSLLLYCWFVCLFGKEYRLSRGSRLKETSPFSQN